MSPATSRIARPPIRRPRLNAPRTSYTAGQLAKRYGFFTPPLTQTQWVAVISLGGGFSQADINSYCQQYGLPVPPVKFVSVQGAANAYTGDGQSADGENALDIQNIIGATGGKVGILVYGAPNTDAGFAAAIAQVASDDIACVCTISWGSAEPNWSAPAISAMNAAIQACLAKNILVFAASGDDGSSDGGNGNNVDFPASSPYVVGCGGTTLTVTGETAWNSGGGGVSVNFPRPSYQASVAAALGSGRLVPDLALDADPNSGYPIVIGSAWDTYGGTSAVGPMMAAGVALAVSATGNRISSSAFMAAVYGGTMTDIVSGSNTSTTGNVAPKFTAGKGFDLCTGNGTPNTAFWAVVAGNTAPPSPPPPPSPPTPPGGNPPSPALLQGTITLVNQETVSLAHIASTQIPIWGHSMANVIMASGQKLDASLTQLFSTQGVSTMAALPMTAHDQALSNQDKAAHIHKAMLTYPNINWGPILAGLEPIILQILQGLLTGATASGS